MQEAGQAKVFYMANAYLIRHLSHFAVAAEALRSSQFIYRLVKTRCGYETDGFRSLTIPSIKVFATNEHAVMLGSRVIGRSCRNAIATMGCREFRVNKLMRCSKGYTCHYSITLSLYLMNIIIF